MANPILRLVVVGLMLCCFVSCPSANAQAAAETAGATSVAGSVASSIKAPAFPKFPAVAGGSGGAPGSPGAGSGSSPHLVATNGPAPEDRNRKALEAKAGKDAGKVLLRSMPVEAQIWVNGQIVGKTPLLLVLPPGKYQVEMRGARGQTGRQTVDLLPRETREAVVKLEQLYPGRVTFQH